MGRRQAIPLSERQALTVPEVAGLLGISTSKTYELVRDGTIPSVRLGTMLRVPRRALEELMEAHNAPGR